MFLIIWLGLILISSVIPAAGLRTELLFDKFVHFIMYGLTSIFFFRHLEVKITKTKAVFASIVLASAYGAIMEFIQHFLPYRSFSLGDIAANTTGAIICCIVYSEWRKN